jgi:hypothetical protein
MSSTRRTANEINILAMLDRHETGGLPRRLFRKLRGRKAMVRFGAAGVLVCGLVGVLVWLAQDSGAPGNADAALAGASGGIPASASRQAGAAIAPLAPDAPAAESAALPEPAAESAADNLSVKVPDAAPHGSAAIVDVAPAEPAAPAVAVPTPAPAASATPALPPQAHAGRIASHRPAAAKPAAPSRTPALVHAETRPRRSAQPSKPGPASVDTDVALISAIIQHANKRQEADEAAKKP